MDHRAGTRTTPAEPAVRTLAPTADLMVFVDPVLPNRPAVMAAVNPLKNVVEVMVSMAHPPVAAGMLSVASAMDHLGSGQATVVSIQPLASPKSVGGAPPWRVAH
eukprot:TRINITY_DN17842_c0_g1_i1.p3 TRINITY_DN17842_c0_g1~~TRINITY_DN17842_c0_g1_i1.p3  ORF type:complete len:105 (+),score=8.60 TRINITY_DN17842_c0_g1_i1:219-533(+)